ncbi:MAG: exosortase C-terminal domain/associated protein EpsI [Pseudomonadota bacterium]
MNSPGIPEAASPRAGIAARLEWRAWVMPAALVAVVLATGVLYFPSTQSLLTEWFDVPSSAYRHGSLIVLGALWLLVRGAREGDGAAAASSASLPRVAAFLPLMALAATSLAWLIALRAGVQVAHQALLPILFWLNIRVVFGPRIALRALVPVGLLYSAVPVWHVFVPALQSLTVSVVSLLLRVIAVPAYVAGDFVYIRSGVFHVEDGCAGLHYFIVAATIAILQGELRGDRLVTRCKLLALAVGLALLGNWLRVLIIIVAGDLTDMQSYLVRVDHSVFGWVVFAVAMVVFLLISRRMPLELEAGRGSETASPTAAAFPAPRRALRAAGYALLASGLGPGWSWLLPVEAAVAPNVSVPSVIAGWDGPVEPCHGRWRPQYRTADLHSQREFSRAGAAVCVYTATYLSQQQDKELIGFSTSAYGPEANLVSAATREVGGRNLNEVQLGNEAGSDRIVWYAYVVGEREVRRGSAAQLRYALGTLRGAPAASVFAISASCLPDCASARQLLTDFLPHVTVGAEARAN